MEYVFNRDNKLIQSIAKIYLTKEERQALTSAINLPDDLKPLVKDHVIYLNELTFDWDNVTAEGYQVYKDIYYPITWLNAPALIKKHLEKSTRHTIRIIIRVPTLKSDIPYDFPRVLISKSFAPEKAEVR
jgi:hypothetical protein